MSAVDTQNEVTPRSLTRSFNHGGSGAKLRTRVFISNLKPEDLKELSKRQKEKALEKTDFLTDMKEALKTGDHKLWEETRALLAEEYGEDVTLVFKDENGFTVRDQDLTEFNMNNMEFMGVAFTRCLLSGNGLQDVSFDLSSVADSKMVQQKVKRGDALFTNCTFVDAEKLDIRAFDPDRDVSALNAGAQITDDPERWVLSTEAPETFLTQAGHGTAYGNYTQPLPLVNAARNYRDYPAGLRNKDKDDIRFGKDGCEFITDQNLPALMAAELDAAGIVTVEVDQLSPFKENAQDAAAYYEPFDEKKNIRTAAGPEGGGKVVKDKGFGCAQCEF